MKRFLALICTMLILLSGCTDIQSTPEDTTKESSVQTEVVESNEDEEQAAEGTEISAESASIETTEDDGYRVIEVAAGDLSGYREANVKVDIGFGDREYWAYTNEYGQLVRVTAKQIILQDDATEPVNASGRYCNDEAKVPGVEDPDLDEGHVIADSLGGVSNAYNITPQNSTLNRHGDQAYMEKVIRDAGGCSDFEAIITYPDTTTQIPNHYKYTYTILGSSPAPAPAPEQPAQTSTPVEGSVWIPASGSKYHNKPSCGRMNPSTAKQISKSEAEAMGYEPCKKCY